MVRQSKANSVDGIQWFDPLKLKGRNHPFIWEDGIHIIQSVEHVPMGISYVLKCGTMFTFSAPESVVAEARIRLPAPTCRKCLE